MPRRHYPTFHKFRCAKSLTGTLRVAAALLALADEVIE
jgi:hypothetical protein